MLTYRPLAQEELRSALRLVLDRAAFSRAELERQIDSFQSYAATMTLSIDRQWGAFEDDRLVASCLTVVSPGRSGMVFLPDAVAEPRGRSAITELLRRVVTDAAARDVRLLQAMIAPGNPQEESTLEAAGFQTGERPVAVADERSDFLARLRRLFE